MNSSVRQKWLAQLASLSYPHSPGQAADAFKAYIPMLAGYPDAAFTHSSLEAVVTAPRRMGIPSYDEVEKPLSEWWRRHRSFPALPAPAIEPQRLPPTKIELDVVAALTRQAVGYCRDAAPPPSRPGNIGAATLSDAHLLNLYDAQAQGDGPFARAAQMRADGLRKKLLAALGREAASDRSQVPSRNANRVSEDA